MCLASGFRQQGSRYKLTRWEIVGYNRINLTKEKETMTTATITREQKTCADLVGEKYEERHRQFKDAYKDDSDFWNYLNENILGYDYVEAGTFKNQKEGYWRLQFSWGGPSDEIQFYTDEKDNIKRVEYVYLDWFDRASLTVKDDIWNIIYEGCR